MSNLPTLNILWLDDKREPNKNVRDWQTAYQKGTVDKLTNTAKRNAKFYVNNILNKYTPNFTWVKNIHEFQNYIETNGLPDFVSFDRDLTRVTSNPQEPGEVVAAWLYSYCQENGLQLPPYYIHSANGAKADRIERALHGETFSQNGLNESRRTVRLTESQLHKLIKESVKKLMEGAGQHTPNGYEVVSINDFAEASQYAQYASWNIVKNKWQFSQYANEYRIYFLLKDGFENIQPTRRGNPGDEYGQSMIAVLVGPDGSMKATSRWNHSNGGGDNDFTPEDLSDIIGTDINSVCPPERIIGRGMGSLQESKRMRRNRVKLTESRLHKVIKESVKNLFTAESDVKSVLKSSLEGMYTVKENKRLPNMLTVADPKIQKTVL